MQKENKIDGKVVITLSPEDLESAVRQFVCACYPEFSKGWIVSVFVDEDGMEAVCEKETRLNMAGISYPPNGPQRKA